MTVFAPLKVLGEDEYVLINPAQVAAIEPANDGKTSRVRLAVTDEGAQIVYEIDLPPKEVWMKFTSAHPIGG
ncbi:hypothetical protein U8C32_08580 [Sinorhizobium medicae]|uniref:hypothetical protein n=1 Tax=Sinorhizobium medicae TaxID=110321 RepID=UPI002AF6B685|nr:hypothetical protein [Sinorhizobium medicae]WQO63888.1 hypothetical protein U8C40_11865 [Sinorhizobium medicae]WQO93609.1 hypothetical protein U8C32_08580 [Sinorhizobium medicae]